MYESIWDDEDDLIMPVYDDRDTVKIYESERSENVVAYMPLSRFSSTFREMEEMGLFTKVFFDRDGIITALAPREAYKTYFVPIIANRNQTYSD